MVYHFYGQFEIHTDCADVNKIAKALNSTAHGFQDAIRWETKEKSQAVMLIDNNLEFEIGLQDDSDEGA
jgi:hypothetical protein